MNSLVRAILIVAVVVAVAAPVMGVWRPEKETGKKRRHPNQQHSFAPPFSFVAGSPIPHYEIGGSTIVTDEFVRLTPDRQSRAGLMFNTEQLFVHNFDIIVEFHIHGSGTRVFGDGMALWLVRDRMRPGPVFGAADKFMGLGVFIDTFDNDGQGNNPMVQVMLGDRRTPYDTNDGSRSELGSCQLDVRGVRGKMRVRYMMGTLTVSFDLTGNNEYGPCISVEEVDIPLGYYIGLSAQTGQVADNHDVHSLTVQNLGGLNELHNGADPNRAPYAPDAPSGAAYSKDPDAKPTRPARRVSTIKNTSGGTSYFLIFVILLIVVGVIGAAGWYILRSSKSARHRF